MENKTVKMTTYTDGFEPHVETDPLRVYKWLAEVYLYKHKGCKDIRRIVYREKYDGNVYATFYISNGTKVEVIIPRG